MTCPRSQHHEPDQNPKHESSIRSLAHKPFATPFPALKEIPFSILLFKMGHLAGVVENSPQMRDEKLATSHGREELPVRFAKLPPLIETSLVGRKSSIPEKVVQENKEKERIIAESGVPQVKCFHCVTTIGLCVDYWFMC